jgi:c(7)-type cytochrome triheme protein
LSVAVFDYLDNTAAFLYLLGTMKTATTIYRLKCGVTALSVAVALAIFIFTGVGLVYAQTAIVEEVVVEEEIITPSGSVLGVASKEDGATVVISGKTLPTASGDGASALRLKDAPLTTFKKKWDGNKFNKRHNKYLKYDKDGQVDATPEVVPLDYLPRDDAGFIDWTRAMREGTLRPLEAISVKRGAGMQTVRYDEPVVLRPSKTFMPDVIFPHDAHNDWLNCGNCHDGIFKMKKKASGITMKRIWKGDFCGRCHDKVAFPLRHCFRCHAGERGSKFTKPAPVEDNYIEYFEYE